MSDDKKTPGDVKLVPKVTVEQALKVLEADVSALLEKTIKGFELNAGDVKSRKRIFGAFVAAGAQFMVSSEALGLSSLSRRCDRAIHSLYPKTPSSKPPALTSIDGGLTDEIDVDDESSDDADE